MISAITKKDEADKLKVKKEESAREALAFEELQMEMATKESKRLNQEEVENSKVAYFTNFGVINTHTFSHFTLSNFQTVLVHRSVFRCCLSTLKQGFRNQI